MATPELAGIHHVKIAVTDLARSLGWYRRVFGLRPTIRFPDADGEVRGFDPVSFAVRPRDDLVAWAGHLDALGIGHSPVVEASIGWLLVFDDPDGLTLHLYTWDAHGLDVSDRPGYGQPIPDPESWRPG